MRTRIRRVALLGGVLAVPALVASMAYACVSLATLSLSSTSGNVGQTITGTGKGFSGMMGANAANVPSTPAPVEVRWGSRNGAVLWTGLPDGEGAIAFSFEVPKAEGGEYVVFATQTTSNGNATSGTPARASFTLNAPAPAPAATPVAAAETTAPAPAPAAAPVAEVTPAPAPAPAARVRVAPAARVNPAPATPVAAAPAPEAAPAPAVEATPAPAVEAAPAPAVETAPARRSVMVSMAGDSSEGSPALAIALVGVGLVLALAASAVVLAGRRDRKAPASARR